jgi:hypothetical protein
VFGIDHQALRQEEWDGRCSLMQSSSHFASMERPEIARHGNLGGMERPEITRHGNLGVWRPGMVIWEHGEARDGKLEAWRGQRYPD